MLGIRGANPIWSEVDLQGHLFDGTFYLFVLENTIPYMPATVYHDPDLAIAWTQPIQFLANGTLPFDIYYESDKVYRLEFRQGDTQAAPLIYEVDNYVPGTGGSSPVDTVTFPTTNQITNPQFALYNLTSPYTITGTDPAPIPIAPGWVLELGGTGSVTISQVPLNNLEINPTNAPYALHLQLNGWTDESVILRQRFEQNGMLWSNNAVPATQIISSAITAQLIGAPQPISATLVDSNQKLLGTILSSDINQAWQEYTGHAQLPATTDTDLPPSAYLEYRLNIPSNINIYITSIQVIAQNTTVEPSFQQDSINRQIDHTYNTAYPIIPVGSVITYGGFDVPPHYLVCDYSTYSRTTYSLLFNTITTVETVTLTNATQTFTVASGSKYRVGMGLEGAGVPNNTIIIGISGNTITMSLAATQTGPRAVRFFASNQTYTETVTLYLSNVQHETVSLTSGSPNFTVADGTIYQVGCSVTGTGIPASTFILSIVGNTVTLTNNATSTVSSNLTFTSLANIFNVASTANYQVGMLVTGYGIAANTTITNITGLAITMSNNASFTPQPSSATTVTSLVSFYHIGNGDGSTTFNVYGLQDRVIAGLGGSLFGSNGQTALGASGGSGTHTQTINELITHTHPTTQVKTSPTGTGTAQFVASGTTGPLSQLPVGSQGGGQPFSIVQPTTIMQMLIRYE